MSRLVVSAAAHADLDAILDYLAAVLCNPVAASALANAVSDAYLRIQAHPESSPFCAHPRLAAMGYRKAPVRNYLFVYRHISETDTVFVARFFHQSRTCADLL